MAVGEQENLRLQLFQSDKRPKRPLFIFTVFLRKKSQTLGLQIDQGISKDQSPLMQERRLTGTKSGQGDRLHSSHRISGAEPLIGDDVITGIGGGKDRNSEALSQVQALPLVIPAREYYSSGSRKRLGHHLLQSLFAQGNRIDEDQP